MTKLLLTAVTALIAVSCSPKALIKDQSGTSIAVKNIKSTKPLLLRFGGGTTQSSFKAMSSFSVNPSIREIYAGQTWVQVEYSLKKDKTGSMYKGWIPQLSQLSGSTATGRSTIDLTNVQNLDFMMGKKKGATPPKGAPSAATDSLQSPKLQ